MIESDSEARRNRTRTDHVRAVIDAYLTRREHGEVISDDDIVNSNPDLMPELGEELSMLALIGRARVQALGGENRLLDRNSPDAHSEDGLRVDLQRLLAFQGYDIERKLHQGGQGVVYLAYQRRTKRPVAIKILREGPFGGAREKDRFEREVNLLSRIKHPNIVTIHDSGNAGGYDYVVMDFVDGLRLDDYIAQVILANSESSDPAVAARSAMPLENRLDLFARICDAVNAAHLRGVIHRDLKPGNIIIDASGAPYVLDFGLAKLVGASDIEAHQAHDLTITGQFVGSRPWASPEQIDSATDVDIRSDVYSLGVILYQMLTGRLPGSDPPNSLTRRNTQAPQTGDSTYFDSRIDDEVSTIVHTALRHDRERRYQSVGELAADVRRYLAKEPIEAKRDSRWYVLRKTLLRFRVHVAVASVLVAVLIVSTAVSWSLWRLATQRELESRETLYESLESQARAIRHTQELGRRRSALSAISKAAAIRPSPSLRNEMIAALAVVDANPRTLPIDIDGMAVFDDTAERCAVIADQDSGVTVIGFADSRVMARIPALAADSRLHWAVLRGNFLARVFDAPSGGRTIELWRLSDERLFLQFDQVAPLGGFDITRDGATLAVALSDRAIHFFDLETGQLIKRVPTERMPSRMSFDPTGRYLALYHGDYRRVAILNLETGANTSAFGDANIEWSVAWSSDARMLFGAEADQVHVWDVESNHSAGVLRGHEAVITNVDVSSDGRWAISRSWDEVSIAWNLATREPLFETKGNYVHFSADGNAITGWTQERTAAGRRNRASVLDMSGNAECQMIAGRSDAETLAVNQAVFDDSDTFLLNTTITDLRPELCGLCVIDGTTAIQVAELGVGKISLAALDRSTQSLTAYLENMGLCKWPVHGEGAAMHVGSSQCVVPGQWTGAARSSDGRSVAYSARPGQVSVVSLDSPTTVNEFACDPRSVVLALSSHGDFVLTGSWHNRGAEIWNTQTKRRQSVLATSSWTHAAFGPNDHRIATGDSERLCIWDVQTGHRAAEARGVHSCVTFSPDAEVVAAAQENLVRVYDARTLKELCTLEPPIRYPTTGLAFGSDGTRLVQMSNRAGIGYIWNLRRLRGQLADADLDWDDPD